MISATHGDGRKQCWGCLRSEYDIIRDKLDDLKNKRASLGKCLDTYTFQENYERIKVLEALIDVRYEEKACWIPDDEPGHDQAIDQARDSINKCNDAILRTYGKKGL